MLLLLGAHLHLPSTPPHPIYLGGSVFPSSLEVGTSGSGPVWRCVFFHCFSGCLDLSLFGGAVFCLLWFVLLALRCAALRRLFHVGSRRRHGVGIPSQ
ncbi:uncharacterized protein K452DRAFT_77167 [Aplosporella prunicola CBS 121167]|uniref:Uncharacterized protein n=1 Tax=Aplosporella prunicola CBS 121167 TaxID=1176127 RepID=A0A6A6B826_9PEZI|nr:uncharacterized protein K452DRAFT_77167 [Aplosporella prunicola CBS 121167]KAF2139415.1 hypothetical protein K452DRAFT_77167 [Aplosporella prunicola CBS 121167]